MFESPHISSKGNFNNMNRAVTNQPFSSVPHLKMSSRNNASRMSMLRNQHADYVKKNVVSIHDKLEVNYD